VSAKPHQLPVLGLLLASLVSCSEPPPPNVVLITLDTTRVDYLSTYGAPAGATPHMDALAARGVRFDLALSASAVTPVSHATILTGLFPYEHGLRVLSAAGGYALPESIPTIATTLQSRGYETIAVHSAFPVSGHFGFNRGFDVFDSFDLEIQRTGGVHDRWDTTLGQRRSDETTDIALARLRETDGPFFLWIHYWDPHDGVLLPPQEYLPDQLIPNRENIAGRHSEFYAAEIRYVDAQIGRLLAGVADLDNGENTVVCLTADHGEGLDDGLARHGWWAHRILYQEQIHVPLIFAGPGVPAGRHSSALVRTADCAATIYDLLDVPPPRALSGRTLRPLMHGAFDPPRAAYSEQINGFDYNASMVARRPQASFLYSVAMDGWKLIYRPTDPNSSELYELTSDPGEERNLFAVEVERAQALMRDLALREPWVLEPFLAHGGPGASEEAQALLEALGYAGGGGQGESVWSWYSISTGAIHHEANELPESDRLPVLHAKDT
jgi:arylsulfatase A-like enzyme